FACSAADLFESISLAAPIDQHRLSIANYPHLYPLARLLDEYPRYVALLADTHLARIFVYAANRLQFSTAIESLKTRRHKMGGWSQARYQRHVDNFHSQHAKEVVDALAKIVREEDIRAVVISGDEVILPLLKQQMGKELAERIVDVVKLEVTAPEAEVLRAS